VPGFGVGTGGGPDFQGRLEAKVLGRLKTKEGGRDRPDEQPSVQLQSRVRSRDRVAREKAFQGDPGRTRDEQGHPDSRVEEQGVRHDEDSLSSKSLRSSASSSARTWPEPKSCRTRLTLSPSKTWCTT